MLLGMQLTIEIPDDQASRLGMDREGMQQLIARIITQLPKLAVVDELIEFLGRGPQPEQIVAFQVSQDSQSRVRDLLDKSRAGTLSKGEESELNAVESLNHLFALIKARAWQRLPSAS
jgi:histidyl-tRNA synthetase